jgi:hypothetical protein
LDEIKRIVLLTLVVTTAHREDCAQNPGSPEKIVLTEKDGTEAVLTVPLEQEPVKVGNGLGSTVDALNATGKIAIEDVRSLVGRDYDFHLIYSTHQYKDVWRKGYAQKILQ